MLCITTTHTTAFHPLVHPKSTRTQWAAVFGASPMAMTMKTKASLKLRCDHCKVCAALECIWIMCVCVCVCVCVVLTLALTRGRKHFVHFGAQTPTHQLALFHAPRIAVCATKRASLCHVQKDTEAQATTRIITHHPCRLTWVCLRSRSPLPTTCVAK